MTSVPKASATVKTGVATVAVEVGQPGQLTMDSSGHIVQFPPLLPDAPERMAPDVMPSEVTTE